MSSLLTRLRKRRDRAQDEGSALVLAILVVLMVGTGLAIVLDYTGVGLTLAPSLRDARNESNYVQGAVEGAVNQVRGSTEIGREDSIVPCPTYTPPVPAGVTGVSGKSFTVECAAQSTGSTSGADVPRFAIHALGAGNEGVIQGSGNGQLYINGGIYSSGKIVANNTGQASMRVNGTYTARNGCSGDLSSTDPIGSSCSAPASAYDTAPAYWPALGSHAALQSLIDPAGPLTEGADPVPTCPAGKVEFSPGYYQLNPEELISRAAPSCAALDIYHFAPGIYYFDYPGQWAIGNKKVIAGTYLSSTLGASCDHNDDAAAPAAGAQFIFGGSSSIQTNSSSSADWGLEICGPERGHALNGNPQRIAMYVLSARDSLTTPAPVSVATALAYSAGPASSSTPAFLLPENAQTINGVPAATDPLTFTPGSIATLEYLPLTTPVPKGSTVEEVRVDVQHTLVRTGASLTLSWPDGSTAGPINVDSCPSNGCDITSHLASQDVTWRALQTMSIIYTARANSGGGGGGVRSATMDGIAYNVVARAPGLRATTCNTSACWLVESSNNPNIFFHGTVYAPTAGLNVWIHNSGESIFDRGVIIRTININMNSSSKQESSPFQLPRGTPDGRSVLFIGKVNGVEKVRACVRYNDTAPNSSGQMSAYAGYSLTVPRWLVMRTPSSQTATCS